MEPGQQNPRGSSRKIACLLLGLAGLLCCGLTSAWSSGIGQTITTWEQLNSVQVIAGPGEMWLFLEVDRMVHLPGALVSAPVRSVGHRQAVAVVQANGQARRVVVAQDNGASIHSNLGHIFHQGDRVYLLADASMGTRRSVFLWRGDRFELMPMAEGDGFLRANALSDLSAAQINPGLDALTASSGWQPLLVESTLYNWDETKKQVVHLPETALTWNGRTYVWDEEVRSDEVVAASLRGDDGRTISLVEYDPRPVPISREAYQRLCGQPRQRGHSR